MNNSPQQPPGRDPFEEILNAVVCGDASESDLATLNGTLRTNPEARLAYIRTMAFEAMVAWEFAPPQESPATARRHRWLVPATMAATIMLAATMAWYITPPQPDPLVTANDLIDSEAPITHAVITSLDDASGHIGKVALTQGLRLTSGLLELERGIAGITFDSGAEVTLEGPARLQLETDNKSRLDAGRASAQVPEQARGFVIHTPSSYIRDLGTAFAVEVRDNRETDLHVLEGSVEVAATGRGADKPPRILRQQEAVRLAGGSMLPINFQADNPGAKRRKHLTKIPPSGHWSFDSWDGSTTTDTTSGLVLKLQQKNNPNPVATLEDGPFGPALHFDGKGTFARADDPATNDSQGRTVACWIRLQPPDSSNRSMANEFIVWGTKRAPGKWRIAWNQSQSQGTLGALRIELGDGFVIGATDLRDGRWHHLAVVCLGGPKPNIATHVRIYCDGRLEALTGRHPRRIANDSSATATRTLTLGRALGQGTGSESFFEGDLDELHIFEGTLLPNQIMRLMKRNSLRPTKP